MPKSFDGKITSHKYYNYQQSHRNERKSYSRMRIHEEPRLVCGVRHLDPQLVTRHSMRHGMVVTVRDGNDRLRKGILRRRFAGHTRKDKNTS